MCGLHMRQPTFMHERIKPLVPRPFSTISQSSLAGGFSSRGASRSVQEIATCFFLYPLMPLHASFRG
jgi:hypothetical protein